MDIETYLVNIYFVFDVLIHHFQSAVTQCQQQPMGQFDP